MLLSRGWVLNPLVKLFSATAGFLLGSSRINKLLNALRHIATLIALQVVQLICCRLGSTYVLHGRGVDRAVGPEDASDGGAALSDCA